MKISQANRIYLARDTYNSWKRMVSRAKDSITIYSPYFDKIRLYLLGNTLLENARITVVTSLDLDSILEMPYQLRTIKRALSKGISVVETQNLHAKVLLVDDKYITTGSQNFTSHGRKSKECTVIPREALDGTHV
jgi:phosphatidylserine/phosphatidylglycerophosphate/cardiolipin synthase-like enzyme